MRMRKYSHWLYFFVLYFYCFFYLISQIFSFVQTVYSPFIQSRIAYKTWIVSSASKTFFTSFLFLWFFRLVGKLLYQCQMKLDNFPMFTFCSLISSFCRYLACLFRHYVILWLNLELLKKHGFALENKIDIIWKWSNYLITFLLLLRCSLVSNALQYFSVSPWAFFITEMTLEKVETYLRLISYQWYLKNELIFTYLLYFLCFAAFALSPVPLHPFLQIACSFFIEAS